MAANRNRIFFLRKITKWLYRYRGLSRVADLVRKAYIHDPRRFRIDDLDGDLLFDCALNEHISSQVFWRGDYSTGQLALLRQVLKPGMVFLDAGANKGEFTVIAAKYVSGGKVLAFEPIAATAKELRSNIAANGFLEVEVIEKALGAHAGEQMIYHAEEKGKDELNLGVFTLYPRPGLERPCGKIAVVSLDEWMGSVAGSGGGSLGSGEDRRDVADKGRIDVMKIDIEGGELEMLEGAAETIRRWKPVIFIEVNAITSRAAGYDHRELLRWLERMGYRCERIGRRGQTIPVNMADLKEFQNLVCWPRDAREKIAFFIPDLRGGGAEKAVCNLLDEMVKRGQDDRGKVDQRCQAAQFELVLVNATGVYMASLPPEVRIVDLKKKRTLFALPELVRYLRKNNPSVLIAHLSHANIVALLAKKIAGVKTAVIVVEHVLHERVSFPGKDWFLERAIKKLYPGAAARVAVSEAAARDLAGRLGLAEQKVSAIYNPVVNETLLKRSKQPAAHPWLDKKEMPVFLAVGRLEREKDFAELLEAFALMRKTVAARLILLGEGSLRKTLEEQVERLGIEKEVDMPGFVQNPYAFMASSDVFVLSSRTEGLSNVLIEAMACGCPVIATDCPGGPREILQDGKFGILVPVGDAGAMARAMESELQGAKEKQQAASGELNGKEAAEKEERIGRAAFFSAERSADGYLNLIAEIRSGGVSGSIVAAEGTKRRVVLHVITGLRTGGAERMLCQLLSAMDREHWEPVVISLTDGSEPEARLREMGITVHCLGMRAGRLPGPAVLRKLIRIAKKIRPDLIQGWMYHGNLAAQFVSRFGHKGMRFGGVGQAPGRKGISRVPVIWSIHHSIGSLAKEKKMTIFMIRLGARLSRLPARIVYASYVSAGQHRALGYRADKEIVIPYGVDTEHYTPSPGIRTAVRKELGIHPDDLVIGSVARYHPMKDHENFLRAAALLIRSKDKLTGRDAKKDRDEPVGEAQPGGLRFLLAGRDVDAQNPVLKSLIAELGIGEWVILLGERGDPQRLLSACTIFTVSSSHGEALPMVLLEAMSCGVPCVTTDVGDAGRLVGDTGRVVSVRDPGALAGAWTDLILMGEERRNSLGVAARARIVEQHTLSASASAYAALYRESVE